MMNEQPTAEWLKDPIHVGSIYIKPTEDRRTCSEYIYQQLWYFCCCLWCRYHIK